MGIFDVFRAAIQPAAAARAGYLGGQSAEEDKQRQEAIQDRELNRQSLLDQLKAAMDTSTINRNNAEAGKDARVPMPKAPTYKPYAGKDGSVYLLNNQDPTDNVQALDATGKPILARSTPEPPHTLKTADGKILLWDAASGSYQPTGLTGATPGNAPPTPGERLTAAEAGYNAAKTGLPHPSKMPGAFANVVHKNADGTYATTKTPTPAFRQASADSAAYDQGTLQPAKQSLMDVIRSINTGAPATGASGAPAPDPTGEPRADPSTGGTSFTDAPSAYAAAAAAYRKMLAMPGADPQAASARYNDMIAKIAKTFGQMPTP